MALAASQPRPSETNFNCNSNSNTRIRFNLLQLPPSATAIKGHNEGPRQGQRRGGGEAVASGCSQELIRGTGTHANKVNVRCCCCHCRWRCQTSVRFSAIGLRARLRGPATYCPPLPLTFATVRPFPAESSHRVSARKYATLHPAWFGLYD